MQYKNELIFFAKVIEKELGIVYAEHNYFQLQNRLEEIAKLVGEEGIPNLYKKAQSGITGAFKQLLLDTATNNETSFFRDPKVFSSLSQKLLPAIIEQSNSAGLIRIWSAAASTGQEAVSLSIIIEELMATRVNGPKFEIIGTDISDRVLMRAMAGVYTQLEVQRGLPAMYIVKYFQKQQEDQWLVKPKISERISFQKLNLKENFSFDKKFQIILIRNVLIYQTIESKIEIIKCVSKQLENGGYLILGAGESLMGISNEFETCSFEGATVYRKKHNQEMKAA